MKLKEREKIIFLYELYKELLPQSQKQSLYLYLIEDLTIVEISDILATTRQAVNDAIKKGSKKLLTYKEKLE